MTKLLAEKHSAARQEHGSLFQIQKAHIKLHSYSAIRTPTRFVTLRAALDHAITT